MGRAIAEGIRDGLFGVGSWSFVAEGCERAGCTRLGYLYGAEKAQVRMMHVHGK